MISVAKGLWGAAAIAACATLSAACSKPAAPRPLDRADARAQAPRWEPTKTYAVIAGVLSWRDASLSSFSKVERKDRELFELLGKRGVPASNRILLLDEAATSKAILDAVGELASKAEPGSTLIVYYAGHGMKTHDDKVVFASFDVDTTKLGSTGLHVDALTPLLRSRIARGRVILLADCCYSGGLGEVARAVGAGGVEALALTSAEASNTSTGNWTFTQTVIDALAGRSIGDHDGDGAITLGELEVEAQAAMKAREGQRLGLANHGVSESLVLAAAGPCPGCKRPELDRPFARGSYVVARRESESAPARVLDVDAATGNLAVAFYDYSHEVLATVPRAEATPLAFPTYPVGSALDVTWGGRTYEAKVLKVEDGFHYVTYPGWPPIWDEWMTASRVVGPHAEGKAARKVKVEWGGRYWDAVVLRRDGPRYCVHYVGYGASWDECVTEERVKF